MLFSQVTAASTDFPKTLFPILWPSFQKRPTNLEWHAWKAVLSLTMWYSGNGQSWETTERSFDTRPARF